LGDFINKKIDNIPMSDGTFIPVGRFEPQCPPIGVIQILHGFGEYIGLYDAMRTFARSVPQQYVSVVEYTEGYHTLHQDLGKEKALADTLDFIQS
jgi:alpha-beta hydrolase superfamily lysophospholipase